MPVADTVHVSEVRIAGQRKPLYTNSLQLHQDVRRGGETQKPVQVARRVGRKVRPRARAASPPQSLWPLLGVGARLAYLLCLRAALRGQGWQPIAPPRCRPLLSGAGRVRGQRGTLPGAQGTPRPPRLPRRLPSASPCAPFQASSTCPGNNQFLIQIKETVL